MDLGFNLQLENHSFLDSTIEVKFQITESCAAMLKEERTLYFLSAKANKN